MVASKKENDNKIYTYLHLQLQGTEKSSNGVKKPFPGAGLVAMLKNGDKSDAYNCRRSQKRSKGVKKPSPERENGNKSDI